MRKKAIRWKLVAENPLTGITAGHQCNESRKVFASGEIIEKVLVESPEAE
jgi:hypothetical protein